jgi:membrane-anchored protein YejM (alkaline phosphatase superfamily)
MEARKRGLSLGPPPVLLPLLDSAALAILYETCFLAVRPPRASEVAYLQLFVFAQWALLSLAVVVLIRLARSVPRPRVAHALVGATLLVPVLLYSDLVFMQRANRHLGSILAASLDPYFTGSRELMKAAGLGGARFFLGLGVLGLIVVVGATIDGVAGRLERAASVRLLWLARRRTRAVLLGLASSFVALNAVGAGAGHAVRQFAWQRFHRGMPLLTSLFGPVATARASIPMRLRPLRSEASIQAAMDKLEWPSTPPVGDIVIFAADSLRADAITEETAPSLSAFRRSALSFETSVSGGNGTHVGVYSLFRADPALSWRPDPEGGPAVPLRIARRLGYRIDVLSSQSLSYLNIDRQMLGKAREVATSFRDDFGGADEPLVDEFVKRVRAPHPPTVFFVFLNSTHLPYVWATSFTPRFLPWANVNQSFTLQTSKTGQEGVLNRYRNSVAFVDTLFERVMDAIRAGGHEDEASIVALGDHGEEFWEHGFAGHNSEMCVPQTHVPLFVRLPRAPAGVPDAQRGRGRIESFGTAMDVWPTLLDAAGVRGSTEGLFEGRSMLRQERRVLLVASMDLWGHSPAQFSLEDHELKIVFEMSAPDRRFEMEDVYIVDVLDPRDNPIHPELTASGYAALARSHFEPELSRLFDAVKW